MKTLLYSPPSTLRAVCLEQRIGSVIFYGAGGYTQRFLRHYMRSNVVISAIVDDNPKTQSLMGIPLIRPDDAHNFKFDAIVVSSDTVESILMQRAGALVPEEIPIIALHTLASLGRFSLLRKLHSVNRTVCWRNFGYIPNRNFKHDLRGKLFGHYNFIKRLQARDIMRALDIGQNDVVLDFGCGMGYFTVEMAKLARRAYGVDVYPGVERISIPSLVRGRLKYIQTNGRCLPFDNATFDKILASEVLPMTADPAEFLSEINRVLKPTGRLVISNGAGHPSIRKAFYVNSGMLRFLKKLYPDHFPVSYADYCRAIQETAGTSQTRYLEEQDIDNLLHATGFRIVARDHSPNRLAGLYFSWSQFLLYLRTGEVVSTRNFIFKYLFFSLLEHFDRAKYPGGPILSAECTDNTP